MLNTGIGSFPSAAGRLTATPDRAVQLSEQRTIGEVIRRQAELRPEQPAIVGPRFAPLSYRELNHQIEAIGMGLRRAGFDRSARIAIALPDGPKAALAIVAVACAAVAVPLAPKLTIPELETRLTLLRPNAIVLLHGSDSAARTVAERQGLVIIEALVADESKLDLQIIVSHVGPAAPHDDPGPHALATILQSSGTTAEPKLIPLSHHNWLVIVERMAEFFQLTPEDRCLAVIPVHYGHGFQHTALAPLLTGGSAAFPVNASILDLSEWFDDLGPTWYTGGPTLHLAILEKAISQPDAITRHALRFIVSGGSQLPTNVHQHLEEKFGVPVLEHYGCTEAGLVSTNRAPPGPCKPGTCGIPWPESLIIVGPDGRPLSPGEQGEIWLRGPNVTSGYLDAPELNRVSFVNGCFRTGDIGSLDEDGFLALHGRHKELINRGGEKISPVEVERALVCHPDVAEAAAYAVPHSSLGEDVAAAVILHPSATVTPIELRDFLSLHLAWFKIPRRIVIVDQLPKSITGKVQRRRLKSCYTASDDSLHAELLQLWNKFLKDDTLTIDDDFFEKGGNSLLAMELLLEIERLTGQKLSESILFERATVRQIAARLLTPSSLTTKKVRKIGSDTKHTPIIFYHGDYNEGGYFLRNVVEALGPEQPLVVVAPHGIDDEPIPRSIEAMAADRLPLVQEVQPQGPYRLAGHCNGALLAFETARLLVADGHSVEWVAMIDPPGITARRSIQILLSIMNYILRLAGKESGVADALLAWTWRGLAAYEKSSMMPPAERFSSLRGDGSGKACEASEKVQAEIGGQKRISRDRKYEVAMSTFSPKPLAVPVVSFSSQFDGRPWRRISPDLKIIRVPGGHYDWVTVHARALAHYLKDPLVSIATRATAIGELPLLSDSPFGPNRWDFLDGLNAKAVEGPAVASGQRILRLVAVGTEGRHALGARFGGLAPDRLYRAVAWVKAEPGVSVMIEARDTVDPLTGKPSNYGVARFNPVAHSVVNSTGDILASGAEAARDGWSKVWVDLRTRDGEIFVVIGLLEGRNNRHVYVAAGQQLNFGGFELLVVGSSLHDRPIITQFADNIISPG